MEKEQTLSFSGKHRFAGLLVATAMLACAPGFVRPAHALGGLIPGPLSDNLKWLCNNGNGGKGDQAACAAWWVLDPPGGVLGIGFQLHYDPSKVQIDVANSGFLCDFSSGGSCPPNAPNTSEQIFSPLTVGGPIAGTSYSLTVGLDTVTLTYDLSNNPAPAGPDRDFFALAFTNLVPVDFTNVTFESVPNTGDMFQMSSYCTLQGGGQCGSDNPSYGFTLPTSTPEPASCLLIGCGLIGLSVIKRLRRVRRE